MLRDETVSLSRRSLAIAHVADFRPSEPKRAVLGRFVVRDGASGRQQRIRMTRRDANPPGQHWHAERILRIIERERDAPSGQAVKAGVTHPLDPKDLDATDFREPAAPGDRDASS